MIKLSYTRKMDGVPSWSLPAVTTCPGARDSTGDLVEVCQGCYATQGNYLFREVQNAREHNRHDWKRPTWVAGMIHAIDSHRYFRWFDSGDIHCRGLAEKIYEVIRLTPWCQHWLPTRSYKIPRIHEVLLRINELDNACVRYSADDLDEYTPGLHGSVVFTAEPPEGTTECRARFHSPAACNSCRACWDKTVPTVAYPAHGMKMKKVIRIKALTA